MPRAAHLFTDKYASPASDGLIDIPAGQPTRDNELCFHTLLRDFADLRTLSRKPSNYAAGCAGSDFPDGSDIAEMTGLKAIALMAYLLANSSAKFKTGNRPGAEAIGRAVDEAAQTFTSNDTRGLRAFNKKVGEALRLFGPEITIHGSR